MKKYSALLVFSLSAITVQAQFQSGQAARAVLGQQNFTAGKNSPSQVILGAPSGLAYSGGVLYVADSNRVAATPSNSRIVAFPTGQIPAPKADVAAAGLTNTDCYLCGFPASFSLGQSSWTPGDAAIGFSTGRSQTGLANATAVATDGRHFAVADTDNNRVLIWNAVPTRMNQSADIVLGQTDFNSFKTPQPVNSTSLRGPQGVWIQNGKLFVADTQNNRVLIWNSIPTQNNQAADLVLGQPDLNHSNQPGPSNNNAVAAANQLLNPTSVTSDGTHLLVSDLGFNRVLIWNSIPTTMDQSASVVVGQIDMASTAANNPTVCNGHPIGSKSLNQCQTSLNYPRYALSDGTRLFVADGGNDRVLIWNTIPTTNGAPASTVLGEPDFLQDVVSSAAVSIASTAVDNTGGVDLLPTPQSLAFDGTNLYVSDAYNRRVVVYAPGDTVLPANSVVNWASETVRQEGLVTFTGSGVANDTVTVTIQGKAYTYTLKAKDTPDIMAQAEVALINANSGDPNATAIFAGPGTGTIYLSSKATDLGFDVITLAASASNTANENATASGGYLSAGTAATAAVGMLVEINGANLSDNTVSATLDGTSTVPHTLGGVQVFMDGYACPILKASPTQIVTQVPYNYQDRNSTSVYVRTTHSDGSITVTNAVAVYISKANPGIFNAPATPGQPRPWPIAMAYHQPGNPTAVVSIDGTVTAGNIATITIKGKAYSYTVGASDTLASIAQNLANLINASDPNVRASLGGAFQRIVLTAIKPGSAGYGISVAGSTSASATVSVTSYSSFTCCVVTPGSLITPANPAGPGELITVTAVGLGNITDPTNTARGRLGTGVPYAGPVPNTAESFVTATLGGSTAQVIFAELPQQSYGTYNLQMVVPQSAAVNPVTPLYIAQNAFISNTVTVPVAPTVVLTGHTVTNTSMPMPRASAPPSGIRSNIDYPANGVSVSGTITASGWALNVSKTLQSQAVTVFVDGELYGVASRDLSRPDVCAIFPSSPDCVTPQLVGWHLNLDTTQFPDGQHSLSITTASADFTNYTISQSFVISNGPVAAYAAQRGSIDSPATNFTYRGAVTFNGWFINDNSAISGVSIYVDGAPHGAATYGTSRPDVCAVFPGRAGCPFVGWYASFDTTLVPNGLHTFTAKAVSSNGQTYAISRTFEVSNFTTFDTTHASIDTPSASAGAFSGLMPVGGWALNDNAPVSSIYIYVDGLFLGTATYGGSRPDACAAVANDPGCPGVGFSTLIDTTSIGDGTHTLSVAVNPAAGQSATFTRTFSVANQATAANPIRIGIDAPSASTSVAGNFVAGGWALSSVDSVSNIQLLIDGRSFGQATLGGSRADVCAVFSAPNCPNVGWGANLESTGLSNGNHTLELTVSTTSGHRASAARIFSVSNALTGPGHTAIDTPAVNGGPYLGQALFSGWALNDTTSISTLSATIDGVPYGPATYGSPRPDVCSVFPGRAGCPNVGWTFGLDTTQLADGNHTLAITANNSNGTFYTVSRTFSVANYSGANPMRISIDSPVNTTTSPVFGTINIGGWAIDSASAVGGVRIAIDGVPVGTATYGSNRSDVCTVFSGSAGCPNVGYNFLYDTTLLPNGVHTLSVTGVTVNAQTYSISSQFSTAN